jgi:hypothetical protein
MKRLAAGLIALALIPTLAACGSSSGERQTTSAAATSSPTGPRLDAEEQRALAKVQQEFADYCASHRTSAEPVGSAAIAESLLDFGADVKTADGSTLGEALGASRDKLRTCGAKALAKRLDKAIK